METNLSQPTQSSALLEEVVSKDSNFLREVQTIPLDDSLSQESIQNDFDYFDQRDEVPDIEGPFYRDTATSSVQFSPECVPVTPRIIVRPTCATVRGGTESNAMESLVTVIEASVETLDYTSSSGQEVSADSAFSRSPSSDSLSSTSSGDVVRIVPEFESESPRIFGRLSGRRNWIVPDVSLFDSDSSDEERSLRTHLFDMDHVVPTGFAEE